MMIRTVPGYGEDYSGAASSSSFSGKKNKKKWNQSGGGGGGGAGGGGYGGSGGGRYYQEYSPAYAAYDDFTLSESVTHRDPSVRYLNNPLYMVHYAILQRICTWWLG